MKLARLFLPLAIASAISGCVTQSIRDDVAIREPIAKELINKPFTAAPRPNVVELRGVRLDTVEVPYTKNKGLWLKSKTFSYNAPNPVPLSQVVAAIAAKGVNIVTDMPIDNVTFTGKVVLTDMETALRQVLGSTGFDYAIDDTAKVVTIQPLPTRTWTLPIRERNSAFSSGQGGGSSSASGSGSQATGQGGQSSSASSQSASTGSGSSGSQNSAQTASSFASAGTSGGGGGSQPGGFSATDSPWVKLRQELDDRLTVMVPAPRGSAAGAPINNMPTPIAAGPLPQSFQSPAGQFVGQPPGPEVAVSGELYVKKKVGHYSTNPNTGAVTVSAPHWILNSLDPYFRRYADALTTQISIKGAMILVNKTKANTEGWDLQGFASFAAGRYGALVSNNTLGGVTVNFPNDGNFPTVSTGNTTLGGPLLGIRSGPDAIQIFNNYLAQFGTTYVVQEPRIATTSGVAARFSNKVNDFYTRISQSTAAGNTGAAIQGIDNQQIPIRLGTELSVYPTYDPATGIVRALIVSKSSIQDSTKNVVQFFNTGNSSQQVNQEIPIARDLEYEGEALLRDGDLIVFGGQTEESVRTKEAGLPGPRGPLGGFLGNKSSTQGGGTYYFALKVSITKL